MPPEIDDDTIDHGSPSDDAGSLRDALSSAFEAEVAPAPDPAAPPADGSAALNEQQQADRSRDERGRFAPKTGDAPAAPVPADPNAAAVPPLVVDPNAPLVPPTQPPAAEMKAPGTWSPLAREKWAGVDPVIKAEVQRRERETAQLVQRSSDDRAFREQIERVAQPFQPFAQQLGVSVPQVFNEAISREVILRGNNVAQKTKVFADGIAQYGIDVEQLDRELAALQQAGRLKAPTPAQVTQSPTEARYPQLFRDPRVDQMVQAAEQEKAQRREREAREATNEIAAFAADPKNEFFTDVGPTLFAMYKAAADSGQEAMPLQQAYETACAIHPEVGKILADRKLAAAAKLSGAAAAKARTAAVSVTGQPGMPGGLGGSRGGDMRSDIENSIEILREE